MCSVAKTRANHSERFFSRDGDFDLADLLSANDERPTEVSSFPFQPKSEDISLEFLLLSGAQRKSPEKPSVSDSTALLLQDLLESLDESEGSGACFTVNDLQQNCPTDSSPDDGVLSDYLDTESSKPVSCQHIEITVSDTLCRDSLVKQDTSPEDDFLTDNFIQKNSPPFSLSDIYIPLKDRNDSLSSDCSLSSEGKESYNGTSTSSHTCIDSGYSSEGETAVQPVIDLAQAVAVRTTDTTETGVDPSAAVDKHPEQKRTHPASKPSLFFQTLCCPLKPASVLPEEPSWIGLLEKMNYWQYFTFDTPSPDDIVKQKQSYVNDSTI